MTNIALAGFQSSIVREISEEISSDNPAACILTAPTGSGKTLTMGRALERAAQNATKHMVWFWLAPYEVVVDQTTRVLLHEVGSDIRPKNLATERSQTGFQAGDVWISTAAYISNKSSGLHREAELSPSLASMVETIRSQGFRIGLVVDEAHIGADDATRMGVVCRIIAPDAVVAATATPKDDKLDRFLAAIGYQSRRNFAVDRRDVVEELLNKEALWVSRLVSNRERLNIAEPALLNLLVECAWEKSREIHHTLKKNDVDLPPILLVQVGNGETEADEMKSRLMKICGLRDREIAIHLDDKKSHGKLSDVADDPTIKALIFKLAAGTGFDAPRSFVLASSRTVDDKDHALQFVGRIMRVHWKVRELLRGTKLSHEDRLIINSGRLVVLDDASQSGFRDAASLIKSLRTEVDPDTQEIEVEDIHVELQEAYGEGRLLATADEVLYSPATIMGERTKFSASDDQARFEQPEVFGARREREHAPAPQRAFGPTKKDYEDEDELSADLAEQGLECYRVSPSVAPAIRDLRGEKWPPLQAEKDLVFNVASSRVPDANDIIALENEATGRKTINILDRDLLGDGGVQKQSRVIEDRSHAANLAKLAFDKTSKNLLSLAEPGHQRKFLKVMTDRIQSIKRMSLEDAMSMAHLFVSRNEQDFILAETKEFAKQVTPCDLEPLPELLLSPLGLGRSSGCNAYGFIPPRPSELDQVDPDCRRALKAWDKKAISLSDGSTLRIASIDKTWTISETEEAFIEILENHDGVEWWIRNPPRKPYSVSILKIDGKRELFYPDFVVGSKLSEDSRKLLIETKYDEGDIRTKLARGRTHDYGHVIFIAIKDKKLRLVDNEGRLGQYLTRDTAEILSKALWVSQTT